MVSIEDLYATRQLLALRHPNLLRVSNENMWNSGHFVAACGTASVMKELLSTYPALIQSVTRDGKTPLQLAFEYNNVEVARVLVQEFLLKNKYPIL